jgi:hypothetical protein
MDKTLKNPGMLPNRADNDRGSAARETDGKERPASDIRRRSA